MFSSAAVLCNLNVHEYVNSIKPVFFCVFIFQHAEAVGLQQGKGNLIWQV